MSNRIADFRAIVLDFDGVVVDSEPLHAKAKRFALDRHGVAYPPDLFERFKGRTDADFFAHAASSLTTAFSAEEMRAVKSARYAELFAEVGLVPGVSEFVALVRRTVERLGLATSTTGRDFGLAADRFDLRSWFDAIVTGDDTRRHKPDPEPYLLAIERLGVTPSASVAVEDSPNGIRSAKAAGCWVAALSREFEPEILWTAGADLVVSSFAELGDELGLQGI